ncbi:MAG: hypothetical protein WA419_07940 [Silvibacterium sp.]
MLDLKISTGWMFHGLRAILLENRLLHLVILPEAGGKLWQIRYKPHDTDLLWNHPRILPSRHAINTRYDDVWSGGMDELFPTDEAGTIEGELYPDHGELWTGAWDAETFQDAEQAGIQLRFLTPISCFAVEKTIRLRPESAQVEISYRLTNHGQERFPFLFKLHPAFAVSPAHRIDFPPMRVIREPGFPGTLSAAPLDFPWPHAQTGQATTDLRRIPDTSSRAVHFFYGTELAAGWSAVTNAATGLSSCLRFDTAIFPSCWLFASFGGWRNLNVAVLEPSTGYPYHLPSAIEAGRARWLKAGESLNTSVMLAFQEGLTSVGGISPEGTILPGEDWS